MCGSVPFGARLEASPRASLPPATSTTSGPNLAPSESLVQAALKAKDERAWGTFTKSYRAEMNRPDARRILDLLAALSHSSDFSVGCYCQDERRCHRSVLRELLAERNARLA